MKRSHTVHHLTSTASIAPVLFGASQFVILMQKVWLGGSIIFYIVSRKSLVATATLTTLCRGISPAEDKTRAALLCQQVLPCRLLVQAYQ